MATQPGQASAALVEPANLQSRQDPGSSCRPAVLVLNVRRPQRCGAAPTPQLGPRLTAVDDGGPDDGGVAAHNDGEQGVIVQIVALHHHVT